MAGIHARLARPVLEQPSQRVPGQTRYPRGLETQPAHAHRHVQLAAAHLDVEGSRLLEALKVGRHQTNHGLAKSHHVRHSEPPLAWPKSTAHYRLPGEKIHRFYFA